MAASLVLKIERHEATRSPVPNQPFSLADTESVWVVQSGKLDIFLTQMKDGEAFGARYHVLRVQEGQAVFGVGDHSSGMALMASSVPDTTLLHLSRQQVRDMILQGDGQALLALLEDWIEQLAAALSPDVAHLAFMFLEPGGTIVVPEHPKALVPRQGVAWVTHRKGESRFLADDSTPAVTGQFLFPVSKHGWLKAAGESEVFSVDTAAFLQQDTDWQGLKQFHALAMSCLVAKKEGAEGKERVRLRARAEADSARIHSSLLRLTAPIQKLNELVDEDSYRDPLFLACEVIGKRLGLKMKPHPDMVRGFKVADPVSSIAKASGVRVRSVALKGEWWRQDNGPFLAFMEESKKPVALLPGSAHSYNIFDPAQGHTIPVTAEIATLLKPFAYVIYRPFPPIKLSAWNILKFGLLGCKGELLTIVFMGIAAGLLGIITPYATGVIFDTLIPGSERAQLAQMTVFLIIIAIATTMVNFARNFTFLRLEGKLDAAIQAAVWDRLLSLPVSFFRDYSSGDLAQRSLGIAAIRQALTGSTFTAILSGIFSIFSFFLLFYFSWKLAFIASLLVLCAFLLSLTCGVLQLRRQRQISLLSGRIASMLLQFVIGIAKFRVSGTESRAFAAWAREFSQKKQVATEASAISNVLTVFNSVFPLICNGVIFYCYYEFLLSEPLGQAMTTGMFLAFLAAFIQFLTAALLLSSAIISALNVVPAYERAKPIFHALPEGATGSANPGKLTGAIELNNISFRYRPNTPLVLRDVSLRIEPGQFVAFVGASGSGKSTLVRLLLGFEVPESGAIFYDGQDLTGLDVQAVRQQMGVVLQSTRPINGSIFQNIVGSAPLSVEDAWEAARLAGIDQDIHRMPMGMHTHLGDGGGSISGGQRQRLMIARAIVGRPRILLFDEATSALDNHTQAVVSRSLESLQATRVVIAHRLTTIIKADRIFVMDRGSIVQSGTYEELIGLPGLFRELAIRQMA